MATNEPLQTAADEVAAAEAELKAAQERLDAAKAKLAAESDDGIVVEAVAVEDEPNASGDAPAVAAEEAPVAPDNPPAPQPTWVPYPTMPASPADAAYAQPSYGGFPQQTGTVPPAGYADAAQAPGQGQAPGYAAPQTPHAGPGAVPPQQPYYGYQQPYYQQPYAPPVVATKDHVAAGLLAIFLGWLGIHKFYLGYNTSGFVMLGVSILGGIFTFSLATWVIWVIAIIEGILYLTKSQSDFERIYVFNKREWF